MPFQWESNSPHLQDYLTNHCSKAKRLYIRSRILHYNYLLRMHFYLQPFNLFRFAFSTQNIIFLCSSRLPIFHRHLLKTFFPSKTNAKRNKLVSIFCFSSFLKIKKRKILTRLKILSRFFCIRSTLLALIHCLNSYINHANWKRQHVYFPKTVIKLAKTTGKRKIWRHL